MLGDAEDFDFVVACFFAGAEVWIHPSGFGYGVCGKVGECVGVGGGDGAGATEGGDGGCGEGGESENDAVVESASYLVEWAD